MSCTTAADSRRVTVFQCRSMNTKATTVCRMTMGTIMIRRARAYSPVGIQPLNALPIQLLAAETRPAAVRISVRPVSSVLIGQGSLEICSRRGDQAIADAAYRLQEQRIGGVAFDLAPEPVDLHVHRALVDGAVAGQRTARHGVARYRGENAQHLAFAVGEMNGVLALTQFASVEMIDVGSERDLLQRLHRRRRGALENITDSQDQFARLERLGDIIVGADLQALDPGF